jgi:hypothetical protein
MPEVKMRQSPRVLRSLALASGLLITASLSASGQTAPVPADVYIETVNALRERDRPVVLLHPKGGDTLTTHWVAGLVGAKVRGASTCGPQRGCRGGVQGDTISMRFFVRSISDSSATISVHTWRKLPDADGRLTRGYFSTYLVKLLRKQNKWRVESAAQTGMS